MDFSQLEDLEVMDTLNIQLYSPRIHLDHLIRWTTSRDMPIESTDDLPPLGFMVMSSFPGIGIAAGFIRRCEGGIGLLGEYITNPSRLPEQRNEALDMLTKHIVENIKHYGITKLLAFTSDKTIIVMAKKHGFTLMPEQSMLAFKG